MIDVHNLFFSYDNKREILKNINFSVTKGKVISILGQNGSGKTTLLKCLNALLKPAKGHIYFNSKEISKMNRSDIAKHIAYVPQEHMNTFPYTVLDVVLLGRAPYIGLFSTPKQGDIERCKEILNAFGIGYLSQRIYTEISGGERKLCLVARALASSPEVLLLDEPTAHLDMKHQTEVLNTIKSLSRQNSLTVLMTLHDPNIALLVSDKVILLKEGSTIGQGGVKEMITKNYIEETYDCEVSLLSDSERTVIFPKVEESIGR